MNQKNVCFIKIGIFKDVGYKFQPYFSNRCHSVSIMAYELKNIAILNPTGADYRRILWVVSRNEAVTRLSNSVLEDKGVFINGFCCK